MKIESILIRKDGTKIHFGTPGEPGSIEYHFKPDASGRHVAEVPNRDHINKLLAVSEGFRVVIDDEPSEEGGGDEGGEVDDGVDDGLELLDKHALAKEYEAAYGEPPASALSKPKLIEAIRARGK